MKKEDTPADSSKKKLTPTKLNILYVIHEMGG